MRDLFRAYTARLFRHKLFIVGTALAFAITYFFTANGLAIHRFGIYETDFDYSLTISLGIPGFFSIFTALFLGVEYSDGTIRNKIASGKTRTEIYLSSLAAMSLALAVMTAAWLAGALFGAGTLPDAGFIAACTVKILFYNLANNAVLVLLSMNIMRSKISIVLEFCLFEFGTFMALVFQGLMSVAEGFKYEILRILLNFNPFGQWLISSLIGSGECMMSFVTQILFSVIIGAVMTVTGVFLLGKKDMR